MSLLTSVAARCFIRIESGNKLQQGKQRRAGTATGTFLAVKRYNIITIGSMGTRSPTRGHDLPMERAQSIIEEARHRLQQLLDEYQVVEAELRRLEDTEFRVCIFGSARISHEHPTY